MTKKSDKKSKGGSAYRITRAKKKKPMRVLELGILFLLVVVIAYVASFGIQMSRGHTQEKEPAEMYLNLQVLNGCGDRGVANTMANLIEVAVSKPLSVRVIDTDNFDNFGVEKTFVISRSSDLTAAKLLAEQLDLPGEVMYREIEDNFLDIGATLVLGNDYREVFGLASEDGPDDKH